MWQKVQKRECQNCCGHNEGNHKKQLYFLMNGHKDLHPVLQEEGDKLAEMVAIKEVLKESLGKKFVK